MFACKRCGENLCCQGMSICRYCRYIEEGNKINVIWHVEQERVLAIHGALSDCIPGTIIKKMTPEELKEQAKLQRERER